MSKPDPNKQKELTAESLKRIAKALRIRAKNNNRAAQKASKFGNPMDTVLYSAAAGALHGVAQELDAEATTLRAMR